MNLAIHLCFGCLLGLSVPAAAHDVELIPITIREGKEFSSSAVFSNNAATAKRADVELSKALHKFIAQGYGHGSVFVLFYNFVRADECEREYVIQTVKLTKRYYERNGRVYREKTQYLVEAMRLDTSKLTRKPDQHLKRYPLGKAYGRDLLAIYEVGCGKIPGIADGNAWPFKPGRSYRRLQDYSSAPGLYERVEFDFSASYSLTLDFDASGHWSVQAPHFLQENAVRPK